MLTPNNMNKEKEIGNWVYKPVKVERKKEEEYTVPKKDKEMVEKLVHKLYPHE